MFVSLGFVVVYLYQYYKDRCSNMRYLSLLRNHLQQASLVLRHKQLSLLTPDNGIVSELVKVNNSGWTEKILEEDGSKQILAVSPKVCLGYM